MKALFLIAAATLTALAAPNAHAMGPCVSVAPQPAVTVLAKKTYEPVILTRKSDCLEKSVLTRHPIVKPASRIQPSTELTVGSTVTAPVRFLGSETGAVFLRVGPACLECQIVSWSPNAVTFIVPNMGLGPITAGELEIVRGDGDTMRKYPVNLVRKPELIVHEPASPTEVELVNVAPLPQD